MSRLRILRINDMSDRDSFFAAGESAISSINALFDAARQSLAERLASTGLPLADAMGVEQHAVHSLAWLKVYTLACDEVFACAASAQAERRLTERGEDQARIALGELMRQIFSGIAMSQSEFARVDEVFPNQDSISLYRTTEVEALIHTGNTPQRRARFVKALSGLDTASPGDDELDQTTRAMRRQLRDYVEDRIAPHAHKWHLQDQLIPIEIVNDLGALGVFSITVPEPYGGMGLGKVAMCAVTEELSRGFLGIGSLGTRAEIAAELILAGGSELQKKRFLPRIASGETLATAVFTEPEFGSDLANLKTRATRQGDVYKISGHKTWITHAARADLMLLLARTGAPQSGYRGLSMFVIEKQRGTDADPFPIEGMSGSEIPVLGYRGMREFEITFNGFAVPETCLLGEVEGAGFKHLMQTFESARIQTAARSVGVAQAAFESALTYAKERRQFGKPIIEFPRVSGKLAMIAVETHIARLLTLRAARRKDEGLRCDLEAGAAKLHAARAAWAAADSALQIHGGNGFALASPISRLLCDARVLSIFEGAAEIQAQVIARRILDDPPAL